MTPDDIIATLQRNNLLVFNNGQYGLHINKQEIKQKIANIVSKKQIKIEPRKLKWTPYTDVSILDIMLL